MRKRRRRAVLAVASVGAAVSAFLACAPILGIGDVEYATSEGGADSGEDGTTTPDGRGGPDASPDCGSVLVACNGRCVSLASDDTNCGKCGFACGGYGALCTDSKCTPGTLATNLDAPHAVIVDDTYAYVLETGTNGFVLDDAGAIVRIPLDGGGDAGQVIVPNLAEPAFAVFHRDRIFFTTRSGMKAVQKDGGGLVELTDAGRLFGITEVGDEIFAISPYDPTPCNLARWRDDGGATVFKPVPCGRIVIERGGKLYWTGFPADQHLGIVTADRDGVQGPTLQPDASFWGLTEADGQLYFTDDNPTNSPLLDLAVHRMGLDGTGEKVIARGFIGAGVASHIRNVLVIGELVFIEDTAGGRIAKVGRDGGPIEFVPAGSNPSALHYAGGYIYWVGVNSTYLKRLRVQ